jgi:hypothetical protein
MGNDKKVLIDATLLRMISREGCIEVFWEELASRRKVNPKTTHEEAFEHLNEKYYEAFGVYRYSCYDSFRRRLNK